MVFIRAGELSHCIKLTNPKVFIVNEHFLSTKFHQLFPSGPRPSFVLVNSNDKQNQKDINDDCICFTWTYLINTGLVQQILRNPIVSIEDLAFVLFSSGTTGLPKGVAHTHSNAMAAFLRMYRKSFIINRQINKTHILF